MDYVWCGDELVPGVAAGVQNGAVGVPDLMCECVSAEILPDEFDRVQLGRVGRQDQQCDIGWHDQLWRAVPAGTVDHQQGDGASAHAHTDFGEILVHNVNVDGWHDQGSAGAARRANGAKHIGPIKATVA